MVLRCQSFCLSYVRSRAEAYLTPQIFAPHSFLPGCRFLTDITTTVRCENKLMTYNLKYVHHARSDFCVFHRQRNFYRPALRRYAQFTDFFATYLRRIQSMSCVAPSLTARPTRYTNKKRKLLFRNNIEGHNTHSISLSGHKTFHTSAKVSNLAWPLIAFLIWFRQA